MENKQTFNEIKRKVKGICSICRTMEQVDYAMREAFTKLTNPKDPRFEKFNKTYKLLEIANCKFKRLGDNLLKEERCGLFAEKCKISPEIYFYDKAPYGMIIVTTLFTKIDKIGWSPVKVDLWIKEN